MIRAKQLTRRFGALIAVDRVELHVPRGSVTGFLGPNGAGKTTTMRMLCGVLTPTCGQAWIDGIEITTHPERARARVGYLPESAPIYPEMRVSEYLRFRAGLYRVQSSRKAIDLVIDQCGLTEVRRRIIGQLSKGFRQRVALAAALLHEPVVLILDEPTAGLDPTQIDSMRSLIRSLAQDRAILLSTHILSEVEAVCDSIVMIAGGQILAAGTLDEVRGDGGGCCLVETDLPSAASLLAQQPGILGVELVMEDREWKQYRITCTPEGDLRATIAEVIGKAGGRVRELHAHRRGLDDVFRSVLSTPQVTGEEGTT
ncbi:MAG: ATP-binding cassette domain-containing protein [Planctomycetota bacterium]|nr:ATP-binding cassette domain-containing protein [Planctomycetota bacterium]